MSAMGGLRKLTGLSQFTCDAARFATRLPNRQEPELLLAKIDAWVWRYNLDALLEELQSLSGEYLDEGVEKVLRDDIDASVTDVDPPRWADVKFDGPNRIVARLGIDQGTAVLQVQLELADDLEIRARTILGVMAQYRVMRSGR